MTERFDGRTVTVLGLARSGEAAARLLLGAGATVRVLDAVDGETQRARATALAGAECILGRTDPADLAGDLVVASPGVLPTGPWIAAATERSIPVWSEIELAYRTGIEPAVAITGTNGKTTTVEMTVSAIRRAGMPAVAAGNIGSALAGTRPGAGIVCEASSFQLWGIDRFRAPVAVLLNIAADHLDWHGSLDAYAAAKARVFENQGPGDTAIVHVSCADRARGDPITFSEAGLPPGGAGVEEGWIVVPQGRVVAIDRLQVRGRAARADAVAAAAAACALGADPDAVGQALASYRPAAHRMEVIATLEDVTFVNDSKATDPHATLAALEELTSVVLIAGGRNKGLDLSELGTARGVRAVVAIGEAAKEIEEAFAPATGVEHATTMEDAVARARALARPGDTVLLSPACASFDMFDGYEQRGEAFRRAVLAQRGGAA